MYLAMSPKLLYKVQDTKGNKDNKDNKVAATGQSDMGCTAKRRAVRGGTYVCNKGNSNSICNLPRLPPK